MIWKLAEWLRMKTVGCRHSMKRLLAQPYDGFATYVCPKDVGGCGKIWDEYDAESDQDPELRL